MIDLTQLHKAVLTGDAKAAKTVTEQALAEGHDPLQLVQTQMMPAMAEVGRRFECNEYFVPELLLSARAMKAALELLRPLLAAKGTEPVGRVALGTVKGDLHDIGKNLVSMMLEGAGFKVLDLGVDLSVEKLVDQVKSVGPDVLGLSALLTTTMPEMQKVIAELKNQGLRDKVKVLVGGAPVDRAFAEKIGADGYGSNAAEAVELARRFAGAK